MLINQVKIRALLSKELGIKDVHHEKMQSYVRAGVMPCSKTGSRGGNKGGLLYNPIEIMECIPYIMNFEFDRPRRLAEQREAKTQRSKDNMKCKEPKSYTNAFNLMNKCLIS